MAFVHANFVCVLAASEIGLSILSTLERKASVAILRGVVRRLSEDILLFIFVFYHLLPIHLHQCMNIVLYLICWSERRGN